MIDVATFVSAFALIISATVCTTISAAHPNKSSLRGWLFFCSLLLFLAGVALLGKSLP